MGHLRGVGSGGWKEPEIAFGGLGVQRTHSLNLQNGLPPNRWLWASATEHRTRNEGFPILAS
jgi:hypothetical protein